MLGHIAAMIYAIQGSLSAEEILARTLGSLAWQLYYGLFVAAIPVHWAIGMRVIVHEVLR
ncbi:hypothetical protein [Leisingera sp. ANG-M1]|uniref:hypothetical protein n=1 Tax=Leisingera sp. ANG-M1 TaxID=1577895 RepID=UPI000A78CCF0|nr:hypothetical protein [Leisingera sp. ANG-M1]